MADVDLNTQLVCPVCAQSHAPVRLERGQKARCARCGTVMARRSYGGLDAPLALALTALILAVPAVVLPFVTLARFGNVRISHLLSGSEGLWRFHMPALSVWVLFCGVVAPLLEITFLALILTWWRRDAADPENPWVKAAHQLQHWSMPEIHVLAVLVSFFKIGSLAETTTGPGFYCYAAAAIAMLAAWQTFTLEPARVLAKQAVDSEKKEES
jgi:paraquat-inducible protein A